MIIGKLKTTRSESYGLPPLRKSSFKIQSISKNAAPIMIKDEYKPATEIFLPILALKNNVTPPASIIMKVIGLKIIIRS